MLDALQPTLARALSSSAACAAPVLSAKQKQIFKESLAASAASDARVAQLFAGYDDAAMQKHYDAYCAIREKAKAEKWDDHKLTQQLYLWRVREFSKQLDAARSQSVDVTPDMKEQAMASVRKLFGSDDALGIARADFAADIKLPSKVKLGDF